MTRATQNNTNMNINMYKNNMNSDYFKNIHCVNVFNIIFFARVIVGINFKHSPNSEPKPLGAINIVAGNFRYLLVYIDHHHCRLSYKLNISSIVCSVCTAITLRVIIIPLCPIFNIYINFWYLKTSSKKIICRATSNSLFIQYLHSVTTLFALSYFRKQTLLWAHTFRFIVEVFSFIWCVYIYASTNPLTTNHYHWIHLRKMSKKELTLYPVHAEPICNFPFHSLNQRDFIDTCITDSTTNSRNSNVGVLIEGRTDYSILGNIDPDTHFLSSNNRIISNYYTENEFNQIPNLDKNFSIFNVNIRSIPKNFDRLRHYLLELNHNFSVISISETWLKQYNKTLYNIKGYTHVSQIREKRTGGGVSMFINNDIKYDVRDNITIDLPGIDTIVIEIPKEELNSSKNTIVLTTYRPPDVNPKSFIEKLADDNDNDNDNEIDLF